MQANRQDRVDRLLNENCHHLGHLGDPTTFSGFSSLMNACHYVDPASVPIFSHQRSFCLSANHTHCPVLSGEQGGKMPSVLQHKSRKLSDQSKMFIKLGLIALFAIVVLFLLLFGRLWFFNASMDISQASTQTMQTPFVINETTTDEDTLTRIQNSPTPFEAVPTQTEITPTPTVEPQTLALDTPIGDAHQFIIHRVIEGETLLLYAEQYNTSVEAITALNYYLIIPMWVDWIIIIPVNITDVSDLPSFEATMVEEDGITLRNLAAQLPASLEDMARYNNINPNRILREGEWLLVPRERDEP